MHRPAQTGRKLAATALTLAGALLVPASGVTSTTPSSAGPVPAPAISGVAPLPGPLAAAATPAAKMGVLKTTPDVGFAGKKITITGFDLPAGKDVQLVWMTANVSWILDARADSVDYIGRKVDKLGVVLARGTVGADGRLSVPVTVPRDFGGIHDIYAVVDGVQLAKGGFLIERLMTITPKKGAVGTPITIRFTGLGSSLYESGGGVYYDNHFTGVFTANTTRGEAAITIRAAGPVGKHQIVSSSAMTANYLNPQQSPIPWANMHQRTFTVTKDNGPPKTQISWPENVAATMPPSTTLGIEAGTAVAKLSSTSGPVLSKVDLTATGLVPGKAVSLQWASVTGNRVNCSGICWVATSTPLGTATANAGGGVETSVTIPDTLGGWHSIQLVQEEKVRAEVPYYVSRSLVGVSAKRVKAGQHFTVHLKGVGWTQLDNTTAVTYDNSYVGYGCGFNSNGDVVIDLVATGAPGTHLIDLYPLLYTQNPPYASAVYGMVPFLSYARDAPGLSLGYRLPAIRVAIEVVK